MAHPWRFPWLILGAALMVMGTTLNVKAGSENMFTPYQQEIQDNLPPGMQMRLPSQVMMNHPSNGEGGNYRVRVFSFTSPKGLIVSLFSCDSGSLSCLVGSFSADSQRSVDAQAALKQHQTGGAPITLTQGVRGYLLEGHLQNPPTRLSSVMWEQDGQIYTVRFLASERQNILYMAYSMANSPPIPSTGVGAGRVADSGSQGSPVRQVPVFNNSSQNEISPEQGDVVTSSSGDILSNPSLETSMGVGNKPEEETAFIPPPTSQNSNGESETRQEAQKSENVEKYICRVPTESEEPPDIVIDVSGITFGSTPLHQIKIIGSSVFDREQINAAIEEIIKPLRGQNLTEHPSTILQNPLREAIEELYIKQGYITSRAIVKESEVFMRMLKDHTLEIQVIEDRLQKIEVEVTGIKRLSQSYICSRLRRGISIPFSISKLEEQLRLMRADPVLENVQANLIVENNGILRVQVKEASPIVANVSFDNYSPPAVGSERMGGALRYRNPLGIGDEVIASYFRSTTGGSETIEFTYRIPVNPKDSTVQLRTVRNRNEITQSPFDVLGIQGDSELYEISYREPLIYSLQEELGVSFGFAFQDGQTFILDREPFGFGRGPDEDGVSRTSVFKLSQDYIRRGEQGSWTFRSQFSFGTDLFGATTNDDPIPDSRFVSWLGQAQRVELLGGDHLLIVQADLQLTPDSLLPSEQFVIGGAQSVRGYRQNVRSGDNAFRFSIEDRITVERNASGVPKIQLSPFVDLGVVWNDLDNPNELPNQRWLLGTGVGLLWDPFLDVEGLTLRLDYGIPLIDLKDRGDNLQDDGFYFGINYQLLD